MFFHEDDEKGGADVEDGTINGTLRRRVNGWRMWCRGDCSQR